MGRPTLSRYIADRFSGHRAQRQARKFEESVEVGETYYSVEACVSPLGEELRVREHHFGRRAWLGKSPMCGPHSAAYLWLNYGPLVKAPPAGVKRLFDQSGGGALPVDEEAGKKLLLEFIREAQSQMARAH